VTQRAENRIYRFGDCELNLMTWEFRKGGQLRPLQPQAMQILALLIEERRRVVPRQDILDRVWNGTTVQDASLTQAIWQIRRALVDDDSTSNNILQTVRGRGYRFAARLDADHEDRGPKKAASGSQSEKDEEMMSG
jgi:DNA-binding winged helix-turn-helix (wHTH) protein